MATPSVSGAVAALKQKGPLGIPRWGWVLIVGGGGYLVWRWYSNRQAGGAAGPATDQTGTDTGTAADYYGAGGGGGYSYPLESPSTSAGTESTAATASDTGTAAGGSTCLPGQVPYVDPITGLQGCCPPGTNFDPTSYQCVPVGGGGATSPTQVVKCPPGYILGPKGKRCVRKTKGRICPPGYHWDPSRGRCVPVRKTKTGRPRKVAA